MITQKELQKWFNNHTHPGGETMQCQAIRLAARNFAAAVVANTSPSDDQAAAIRKIREAMMTAHAAIACE